MAHIFLGAYSWLPSGCQPRSGARLPRCFSKSRLSERYFFSLGSTVALHAGKELGLPNSVYQGWQFPGQLSGEAVAQLVLHRGHVEESNDATLHLPQMLSQGEASDLELCAKCQ